MKEYLPTMLLAAVSCCYGTSLLAMQEQPPIHPIFDNLYLEQDVNTSAVKSVGTMKEYKEKIKNQLSVKFNDNLQLGIDKFKVGPNSIQRSQIVQIEPHLQPKGSNVGSAKGYGLELRVKLD